MPPDAGHLIAYVGCRTTRERNARGDGIGVYRVEPSGRWSRIQLCGGLVNPSFLALDRAGRRLYAVHGDRSEVSAFAVSDDGGLAPLGEQSTRGRNPVHLALDPEERFLVLANHVTSSLAVLPVAGDGSLEPVADLVAVAGEVGPHRVEQPFPKPHHTVFDPSGRFVLVPDKGIDRVLVYRWDGEAGRLTLADGAGAAAREGAGPRHVAFAPGGKHAYVVNELDSTVTACRFDAESGRLEPFQVLSSLSDAFTGNSRAAEIAVHPAGRFLYASNRGADDVAVFAVDPASGRLAPAGRAESGGRTPRFLALDPAGRRLYVANEDSDAVVGFDVDPASGAPLRPETVAETGSPVCIVFRETRPREA